MPYCEPLAPPGEDGDVGEPLLPAGRLPNCDDPVPELPAPPNGALLPAGRWPYCEPPELPPGEDGALLPPAGLFPKGDELVFPAGEVGDAGLLAPTEPGSREAGAAELLPVGVRPGPGKLEDGRLLPSVLALELPKGFTRERAEPLSSSSSCGSSSSISSSSSSNSS